MDGGGNQEEVEDTTVLKLPVHPRKAQELFFELLQVNGSNKTETESEPFKQRVAAAQAKYAAAVKALQRGHWLRCSSVSTDFLVQLRLAGDGSGLVLSQFLASDNINTTVEGEDQFQLESIQQIPVASINRITIHADEILMIEAADAAYWQLEIESEEVLVSIVMALAVSVAATAGTSESKDAMLLWQAVRLRTLELVSGGERIRDAVETMEMAYDAIWTRETECALPTRERLFLLHAD